MFPHEQSSAHYFKIFTPYFRMIKQGVKNVGFTGVYGQIISLAREFAIIITDLTVFINYNGDVTIGFGVSIQNSGVK